MLIIDINILNVIPFSRIGPLLLSTKYFYLQLQNI